MTVILLTVAVVCKLIAIAVLFRSIRRKPHFTESYKGETL
jgi:hypothetical protein